jgi:aminoglycoside 3-N-acetyltransferase I
MTYARLGPGDRARAKALFALMAAVFDEDCETLSDAYVDRLLGRADFWVIAALSDDDLVGGLTAHTLPMTRTQVSEVFIYDLAVRPEHQRRGVGRGLIAHLRGAAGAAEIFVAVDDEDAHALDFYRAVGGSAAPVTIFTFTH